MSPLLRQRTFQGDPFTRAGCFALAPLVLAGLMLWFIARVGILGAPPHGRVPAADFAAFWGAGRLVLQGHAEVVYDWPVLSGLLEHWLGGRLRNTLPIYYPPTFLLLTAPLALASYRIAFFAWDVVGVALYLSAVWTISPRKGALLVALVAPGVFSCLQLGQNGFLTAAVVGTGLALLDQRPRLAGVVLGLLCCKPHLALLVPIALAAGGRWRALGWAAASALAMVACAMVALGPGLFESFFHAARTAGASFSGRGWVRWCFVQTVYGALRAAGAPSTTAMAAQGLLACTCAVVVGGVWRSASAAEVKCCVLVCAALLTTPYVFLYDAVWLGLAVVFLLRDVTRRGEWKSWEAWGLAVAYLSPYAQLFVHALPALPLSALAVMIIACRRSSFSPSSWWSTLAGRRRCVALPA